MGLSQTLPGGVAVSSDRGATDELAGADVAVTVVTNGVPQYACRLVAGARAWGLGTPPAGVASWSRPARSTPLAPPSRGAPTSSPPPPRRERVELLLLLRRPTACRLVHLLEVLRVLHVREGGGCACCACALGRPVDPGSAA